MFQQIPRRLQTVLGMYAWACTRLSYNLLELISMGAWPQIPSEKGDLWPPVRAQSSIILSVWSRLWKTLLKFLHQFTLTYRGHNIQNWVKSYSLSQRPCRPFCSFEKFQVSWRVGGCQTNSEKNWRRKEEEINYIWVKSNLICYSERWNIKAD